MKSSHRIALLIILVSALSMFISVSALACCVYNRTSQPADVNLDCGFACSNSWTISPSGKKCRPGKGGKVAVRIMDASRKNEIDDGRCKVKVDDHGWVSISQNGKKVTVKSKRKSGSVKEKCTMKIIGDPRG